LIACIVPKSGTADARNVPQAMRHPAHALRSALNDEPIERNNERGGQLTASTSYSELMNWDVAWPTELPRGSGLNRASKPVLRVAGPIVPGDFLE
jgi:hypothetical protein